MDDKFIDDEEKLISWIKENYKNIFIGFIIGLSFVLSYKYHQDSQNNLNADLSYEYQIAIDKYNSGDKVYLMNKAEELSTNYPSNTYTNLINLYVVKHLVDNDKISEAFDILNHIIENTTSENIKNLAYIRKIRLLVSDNRLDEALTIIKKINNNQNYLLLELSGDIYYKQNNINLARDAYNEVLRFDITPNKRKLIENKISSIQ
ncbi:MAG: hypothetical protein CMD88_01590 [Gammaproteobacteria bacterium]|nr:hypothetical protein [Gammaproteobacteria bacterium]|tara:strand:+ start:229696 stop:230310 length:615 start_codon:yes stop_codon:yes gene_type:complete